MTPPATEPLAPDPSETRIWSTKGTDFWALLGALLVKARPTSILELGGGRSTTFLADYGVRYRRPCVTLEQSDVWHRKIIADLGFMGFASKHIHHVPLDDALDPPWYELEAARRIVGKRAFDFVFLDGPQGGARRNRDGQALVLQAAREARIVLVDDVHRDYNLAFFDRLAERMPPEGRVFYRYRNNWLGIAVAEELRPTLTECFTFLGLAHAARPVTTEDGDD